jgi:2,4-dichlorophenol 6-monooxygenase
VGALLVRPDGFVAFRHASAAQDAGELLSDALRRILGHA